MGALLLVFVLAVKCYAYNVIWDKALVLLSICSARDKNMLTEGKVEWVTHTHFSHAYSKSTNKVQAGFLAPLLRDSKLLRRILAVDFRDW